MFHVFFQGITSMMGQRTIEIDVSWVFSGITHVDDGSAHERSTFHVFFRNHFDDGSAHERLIFHVFQESLR